MQTLSRNLVAGLLLAAIPHLEHLGLPAPTPAAVLAATGAARTSAYDARKRLEALLPGLQRSPGRPRAAPPPAPDRSVMEGLHERVITFIADHPGCISGSSTRRRYGGRYHTFVLDLWAEHRDLPLAHLARAVLVPRPTLEDWIRGGHFQVELGGNAAEAALRPEPYVARIETILDAHSRWTGGFRTFCNHVQLDLRVPITRQHIDDILTAHGVRIPKRRRRPPDASALRQTFETFGPGLQWVGDGTELTVQIGEARYRCNLELTVDVASGAFVGASIRPTEDSQAVIEAFRDGVTTTGAPPQALLLDNKPSNHTDEVQATLGEAVLLRSRPYVPTDKPHVEGAFGLFSQEAPPMVLTATTPHELAAQVAGLVVTAWARAVNHRPRADRSGKSRVELYREGPTEEEIAAARARFAERLRQQQRAQQTRERRADPVARGALDDAFTRLGLDDPDGYLRTAIASWPLDAVLAGIAIFEGRASRGTLPEGVDGRYLRGIVKNVAGEAEVFAVADLLLTERLRARDRALQPLLDAHAKLDAHDEAADLEWLVRSYVGRAVQAARRLDRLFWLRAVADVVLDLPEPERRPMLRLAARHISAAHRLPKADRHAAIRFLYAKAVPVA
jgi:hypothetical protein